MAANLAALVQLIFILHGLSYGVAYMLGVARQSAAELAVLTAAEYQTASAVGPRPGYLSVTDGMALAAAGLFNSQQQYNAICKVKEISNTTEFADRLSEIEREWPRRDVADRWTPTLILDGWTGVSNTFLKAYSRLAPPLTPVEAMFVVHLLQHKWGEDAPFPSLSTIAKRMGVSLGAVRGYARSLERKGYLKREGTTGKPNKYHFDGLFRALESRWLEDMRDSI